MIATCGDDYHLDLSILHNILPVIVCRQQYQQRPCHQCRIFHHHHGHHYSLAVRLTLTHVVCEFEFVISRKIVL